MLGEWHHNKFATSQGIYYVIMYHTQKHTSRIHIRSHDSKVKGENLPSQCR